MALEKIVRTAKYALLGLAIPIMMHGCKDGDGGTGPNPDPNKPPTITAEANPTEGTAPLTVTYKLRGNDPDNNFKHYIANFGIKTDTIKNISQDIEITYPEGTHSYSIIGEDTEGAKSNRETGTINAQTNKPIFTTDGQNFNQVEQQEKAYALEDLVQNGNITNATITTGPANAQIDRDSLRITNQDMSQASQNYSLELTAENENGTSSESINANIQGRTDLEAGQLQIAATLEPWKGKINIYDKDGNQIKTILTDNQGNYPRTQLPNLDEYTLIANTVSDGKQNVYQGRTLTIKPQQTGQDITALIRSIEHPNPTSNVTIQEKRNYIEQANFSGEYVNEHIGVDVGEDGTKLVKWAPQSLKGVYIFKTNPETKNGNNKGQFTDEEINTYAAKWTATDDLGACVQAINQTQNFNNFQVIKGTNGETHEAYYMTQDGFTQPNNGWIIIQPDTTMVRPGGAGAVINDNYNTIGAKIRMNPEEIKEWGVPFEHVAAHEGIHVVSALGAPGHPSLDGSKTIMNGITPSAEEQVPKPRPLDIRICKEYNDSSIKPEITADKLFGN